MCPLVWVVQALICLAFLKQWLTCFLYLIRTGSNPKIRRNKIWGGQNGGILVYNSGEKRSLFCVFFFLIIIAIADIKFE